MPKDLKCVEGRVGINSVHNTADFVHNTETNNGFVFSTTSIAFTPQDNSYLEKVSIPLYLFCICNILPTTFLWCVCLMKKHQFREHLYYYFITSAMYFRYL